MSLYIYKYRPIFINVLTDSFSVHDAVHVLSELSAAERTAFSGVYIDSYEVVVAATSHKCHLRAVLLSTETGQNVLTQYHVPGATQQFNGSTCPQGTS